MSNSINQKIIDKLRKGYAPVEQSPKANLTSTYKNIFKPLVNRKDFNLLFELFDTDEVILRAWSFLGLHHVLEETSVYEEERIKRIQEIILEVLNDRREISYYGDSIELRTSLREHHVRRIENVVSKTATPDVESLILSLANNTGLRDFHLKNQMVKSFENLSQEGDVTKFNEITSLFKSYLTQINEGKITDQEFLKNVKSLQENIFRNSRICKFVKISIWFIISHCEEIL